MNSSCASVRRARPLLGTLVEISARGERERTLHRAVDAAFAAVERVHRLMSFHSQESDITRLNRKALRAAVPVAPETWDVLALALSISAATQGVFDIAIGAAMMQRHALPRMSGGPFEAGACYRDIELLSGNRVRFHRPLALDVGGIAKGFAVDQAVLVLVRHGCLSGRVNAGGDLRVFGTQTVAVQVRDPLRPTRPVAVALIREAALATTARYARRCGLSSAGHVIDPRTQKAPRRLASASVRAASCAIADALAKTLYLLRERSHPMLAQLGAAGFLLDRGGLSMVGAK